MVADSSYLQGRKPAARCAVINSELIDADNLLRNLRYLLYEINLVGCLSVRNLNKTRGRIIKELKSLHQ